MIFYPFKAAGQPHSNLTSALPIKYASFKNAEGANCTDVSIVSIHTQEHSDSNSGDKLIRSRTPHWWWNKKLTRTESWKPVTLRISMLGGFIIISLSIIILLEILSRISNRPQNGGGIAFAADVNQLSTISIFSFSYLPTILAVCYSMTWSWVDLDVKRLEPWFQLSKAGGAKAEDSLLLQYPFDFLPFVPISALRKKHWGVFLSGIVMLMIFWIITPLQSAIFTNGTVDRVVSITMGTSSKLVDLSVQASAITVNFMHTAYGICWLQQRLPPFTTESFAFLPFRPLGESSSKLPSELWSTTVDSFYTNLTCTPAKVKVNKNFSYTFNNGKGCIVPDIVLTGTDPNTPYIVSYIGYFDNPQNDWSLQNPNCSAAFSNTFLALWTSRASAVGAGSPGMYNNITSLFCETSYVSQEMNVAVNASNHAVEGFKATSNNATQLALTDIFNITNFEYLVGAGVPPIEQKGNYPDRAILQQQSQIEDFGIMFPNTNMVGFATALSNDVPVENWANPAILQRVFEKAHQILFISAFSTLTTESESLNNFRLGNRTDSPGAVVLVRSISIIVEAGFVVIILFTIGLWYFYHKRSMNLRFDPASIASIMSVVHPNGELANDMHDNGTLTTATLDDNLYRQSYTLDLTKFGRTYIRRNIDTQEGEPFRASSRSSTSEDSKCQRDFSPARPSESSLLAGTIFTALLISAGVVITFLYTRSSTENGIPLPSNNAVVLSIMENYAPTAFATLVEPMWNMLNRLLCLLQPFDELRKGNAPAAISVETTYTTVPPQLAVWRALRAKHFVLATVCITAVSTNVLAVSLAALLNQGPTSVVIPFDSTYQLSAQFNGTQILDGRAANGVFFDHFYVAVSNISKGNSLPPWIDQKFFYIPFKTKTPETNSNFEATLQNFRGRTTGFGAHVTCAEATKSGEEDILLFDVRPDGSSVNFTISHITEDGTRVTCGAPNARANGITMDTLSFVDGLSAMEVVSQGQGITTSNDPLCTSIMAMGWVRVSNGITRISTNNTLTPNRTVTQTFLSCTPKLFVAEFDITVDTTGRVLSSNRTSEFVNNTSPYFAKPVPTNSSNPSLLTFNESALFQQATGLISPTTAGLFGWHNSSFNTDWMNALLGMRMNSSSLVDPAIIVPNATLMAPLVQDLYTQLFATLLGLNTHVFDVASNPLIAEAIFTERRFFVSLLMFKVSIIILSFQVIVSILYYSRRPKAFLPRMPTSLASIIAFVAASRAVDDFNGSDEGKSEKNFGNERTYGYGRFIGTDGRTKVGIEQQRFVVPLEVKNPHVKRRKWWSKIGKGSEGEVKSWI